MRSRLKGHWLVIILLQAAAISLLTILLLLLSFSIAASDGGVVYDLVMWFVVPLCSFFASLGAVRGGLNAYAAWIAPPIGQTVAQLLLTGFFPSSPGMPMITLLLSVIGAATGDEITRRRSQRSQKARKRR